MTSQTKHYIEIKDLLALRCDCECGASLSLALKEESARSIEACPSCGKVWAHGMSQKEIGLFLRQIEHMRILAGTMGFNLLLEVSAPVSSGRD
jgi:hypothetical protein